MGACKVDRDASPEFSNLREGWRKSGYPSVDKDLADALNEIEKDIQSCRCRTVSRFTDVLGDFTLLKYRYKNSAAKEGARGGWRIWALHDTKKNIVYPIINYPKKEWADASDQYVNQSVKELLAVLKAKQNQAPK